MLPYVVIHNQMSLDGSYLLKDFVFNPELFYGISRCSEADIFLVGSNTARTGIELFMEKVPAEEPGDRVAPKYAGEEKHTLWVIPDTRGQLQGLLHVYRRSEYCKDLLILVSKTTPKAYLEYLEQREYRYLIAGDDHVDLKKMMELFAQQFQAKRVVVDSGSILTNLLLEQELVDELSLLIAPSLAGKDGLNLFRNLNTKGKPLTLKLVKTETFDSNDIHLVYQVLK